LPGLIYVEWLFKRETTLDTTWVNRKKPEETVDENTLQLKKIDPRLEGNSNFMKQIKK